MSLLKVKGTTVLVVALLAGVAQASFELALVKQNFTPTGSVSGTRITRWDPISATFLGSFGQGLISQSGAIAIDTLTPNTVVNFDSSGGLLTLRRINYNSGQNLGLTTTSITCTDVTDAQVLSNGNMLVSGTLGGFFDTRMYNSSGSLLINYSMPSGTLECLSSVQGVDGTVYVLTRQAGTALNSKFTLTSHAAGSGFIVQTAVVYDNVSIDDMSLAISGNKLSILADTTLQRRFTTVSGTSLGTLISANLGFAIETQAAVFGHEDTLHTFGYDSVDLELHLSSFAVTNISSGPFIANTSSQFGNVYDAAIVLAPEPGTMIALGAGIVALLRRRSVRG